MAAQMAETHVVAADHLPSCTGAADGVDTMTNDVLHTDDAFR